MKINDLKYADLVMLGNYLELIKDIEKLNDDLYKITMKDMNGGKIRVELFDTKTLKALNIKKEKLSYVRSDEYNHYFNNSLGEELIFSIPFIGSDFDYIIGKKEKAFAKRVKSVICDVNPDNIIKDTIVDLMCETAGAKIYYTIDGREPTESSTLYTKPLKISKNTLIKARAYKEGMQKSYIRTLDFKVKYKKIKIFLSPSRQDYNKGIDGSNFTTEYKEMNKICDELAKILEEYDCILYRNNHETFIEDWSIINHDEDIDLHLAIHSNASSNHMKKGVENWIHNEYSETYSLAKMIYDNIYSIYYDNKNPITNGGIKYGNGLVAEASPAYFKFGMNLEVAYHDNLDDAKWIVNNRKEIARAIAKAIIEYYQLEKKI